MSLNPSSAAVPVVGGLVAIVGEAALYVRRHLILLPLLLVLTLPATAIHEGAHAVAAMAQGARIVEMGIGPWASGGEYWGFVRYSGPPGGISCEACVSLAPYVTWALVGVVVAFVALLLPRLTRERSALFVIGFALPPLDLVQHVSGWLRGSTRNDIFHALGPPDWPALLVIAVYGALVAVGGFAVQRRLHGERALTPGAYVLLVGTTVVVAPMLSGALKRLLG